MPAIAEVAGIRDTLKAVHTFLSGYPRPTLTARPRNINYRIPSPHGG